MGMRSTSSTLFPYTTLFRSGLVGGEHVHRQTGRRPQVGQAAPAGDQRQTSRCAREKWLDLCGVGGIVQHDQGMRRSEEHTSELQSQSNLVCRLLLEKNTTHP